MSERIIGVQNPAHFFMEEMRAALHQPATPLSPTATTYLLLQLSSMRISEMSQRPLGELYFEGLRERTTRMRVQKLRHVGDRSLFLSGMFSPAFKRKLVNVEYFHKLGKSAYRHIGNQLYDELAFQFQPIVDLLTEISLRCNLTNDGDVLELYDNYVRTGNTTFLTIIIQKIGTAPPRGEYDGN